MCILLARDFLVTFGTLRTLVEFPGASIVFLLLSSIPVVVVAVVVEFVAVLAVRVGVATVVAVAVAAAVVFAVAVAVVFAVAVAAAVVFAVAVAVAVVFAVAVLAVGVAAVVAVVLTAVAAVVGAISPLIGTVGGAVDVSRPAVRFVTSTGADVGVVSSSDVVVDGDSRTCTLLRLSVAQDTS